MHLVREVQLACLIPLEFLNSLSRARFISSFHIEFSTLDVKILNMEEGKRKRFSIHSSELSHFSFPAIITQYNIFYTQVERGVKVLRMTLWFLSNYFTIFPFRHFPDIKHPAKLDSTKTTSGEHAKSR